MIAWKKLEAGHYKSDDERFEIMQTYDRIYGDHWILYDKHEPNYYKGQYDERTLRECKAKAEVL